MLQTANKKRGEIKIRKKQTRGLEGEREGGHKHLGYFIPSLQKMTFKSLIIVDSFIFV